jgi:hypothetical protein
MFPYDAALLAAVRIPPQSIADVLQNHKRSAAPASTVMA